MRAAEDDGVAAGLLQRERVFAHGVDRVLARLDQRDEPRRRNGGEVNPGVEGADEELVPPRRDRRLRREEADGPVPRRLHRGVCLGRDDADDGNLERLLQVREGGRGRAVARDHDELHAEALEVAADLVRESPHLVERTRAVRQARVVAEIDEVLVRRGHEALVEHCEATDSGVEHADRPRVHGAILGRGYCVDGVKRLLVTVVLALVATAPAHAYVKATGTRTMDDGIAIAYDLYEPDGASPAAGWPGVLLLHGLGGTKDSVATVAGGFADAGYAVLAYSARGHGTSGGAVELAGPREVADLRALLGWFRDRPDVGNAVGCWGISYGGGQCWNAAASGVRFGAIAVVETWTDLYSALWPGDVAKSGIVLGFSKSVVARSPLVASFEDDAVHSTNLARVRPLLAQRSALPKLGSLTTPVYMFQGKVDYAFDVAQATRAFAKLRGPKKLYVGKFGHAPSTFPGPDAPYVLSQSTHWFDHFLRGLPNGIEFPAVAIAKPGAGVLDLRVAPEDQDARPAERRAPRRRCGDLRRRHRDGAREEPLALPAARRRHPRGRQGRHPRRDRPAEGNGRHPTRELRPDDPQGRARHGSARPGLRLRRRRLPGVRRQRLDRARPADDPAVGAEVTRMRLLPFLLALALVPVALAGGSAAPGVTATTITIGGTVPLTGPAALFGSVGRGAEAYFKYVNAGGGVNGRKIRYLYLDDEYNPAKTVELTRKLVEQEKVLAIFNSVGTEHSLAVRDYLNAAKVPQLFVGTGVNKIGDDFKARPWTMGYLPSFRAEGVIYGRFIAANRPKATVGVLYENSDYGKDMTTGLRKGLGKKASAIKATESYEITDSSIESQIASLKASGANTLVLNATPQFVILAYVAAHKLGWRPQVLVSSVSISPNVMDIVRASVGKDADGSVSIAFVKDPTNPRFAADRAVKLYRTILKKYGGGAKFEDVYNFYGMAVAYTMVDALRKGGKNLTRESLLRGATHLDESNPFMWPGVHIETSPRDYYPITKAQIVRYAGARWTPVGKLVSARG